MDIDLIITAVATLAGALGGAALTQRYAFREAQRARAETRRDAQRRVLSELLIAGRTKVERYRLFIPAFGKFEKSDFEEFAETESARSLGQVNDEMSRTLVQASLLVGDSPVLEALWKVRTLELKFTDEVMGPFFEEGSTFESSVLHGLKYNSELSSALTDLEVSATPLLRAPLAMPAKNNVWHALKRPLRRLKNWYLR